MNEIQLYDAVALTEDMLEHKLRRGQVGWVIELLDEGVYEVEFSRPTDGPMRCWLYVPIN